MPQPWIDHEGEKTLLSAYRALKKPYSCTATSPLLRSIDPPYSLLTIIRVRGKIIARHYHERWDGIGYPCGLQGEEISLLARICVLADV